jgi:hypothetical protein
MESSMTQNLRGMMAVGLTIWVSVIALMAIVQAFN